MTRPIKFRAWDTKKNKWCFGYETLGGFSMFGEMHIIDELLIEQLDDIEVMQYTGLKDKNGKEMYEGDIIGFWEGEDIGWMKYRVFWWKENARFILVDSEESLGADDYCESPIDWDSLEIIGNIYENPELLNE